MINCLDSQPCFVLLLKSSVVKALEYLACLSKKNIYRIRGLFGVDFNLAVW